LVLATLKKIKGIAEAQGLTVQALAMRWINSKEGVSSIIPGARDVGQLGANLLASEPLPADTVSQLDAATDALKIALGNSCDIYESDANQRVK